MKKYILNKTPVTTTVNYGINDISLDFEVPEIKEFENIKIISEDSDKIKIEKKENEIISSKIGLDVTSNYNIVITVSKFQKIEKPVVIEFNLNDKNDVLVDNIKIVYEENSSADFILKYNSASDNKLFLYTKQETVMKENSNGKIVVVNLINNNSDSFIAIENTLEDKAELEHILVELGGNNEISNYYSDLKGYSSKNNLSSAYIGIENNLLDFNYLINEYGEKTECNIESQGAINDNSKKNFKGTIDFKKGAKKSKGIENENCLILSDTAISKSLPMLLCHEDDVMGEHGVATGKPDKQKIFYLMTKGLSYEDSRKLIVKANLSKIIQKINNEELEEEINKVIEKLIK